MAKTTTGKTVQEKDFFGFIPEKYRDLTLIFLLAVLVFAFFGGAIFGGGFSAEDNLASLGFKKYIEHAEKQGYFPQWIPYIFGGMPSYGSLLTTGSRYWDFVPKVFFGMTAAIGEIFSNDVARIAMFYVIYGIGMYLLMRFKAFNRFISFFTAFAATFSTCVLVWVMIGHNTKPVVFSMLPYIFLCLEKLKVRFSLLYAALLVFAVHLMAEGAHVQMLFYAVCALGLYLLFELISKLISKDKPLDIVKVAGILVIAGGIAYLMSADRYLAVQEYTPYSTRGSAPIVKTDSKPSDPTGGNSYQYATQWSFSPQEMITFLVPNYFGFGKMNYEGPQTNGQKMMLRTYWGQKPFDDAAPYMGILIFGLGLLGMITHRKDPFVQFLMATSIFSLLLSFGYTFPVLFDVFFENVPGFNKFRAPSMALALMQFCFPILSGYGLASVMKWAREKKPEQIKMSYMLMGASALFLLLGFIVMGGMKDTYIEALSSSKSMRLPAQFHEFIWDAMVSDWMIIGFTALIASVIIYMYVKNKVSATIFYWGLFILCAFDLMRVGARPMETIESKSEAAVFNKLDYLEFIAQDKSVFRIADFASPSTNLSAYFFLQNVNGYHAAKLRVLQDLLDGADQGSTSTVTNPFLWNLMNVKYIITPQPLKMQPVYQSQTSAGFVYENPARLPRAFFVKRAATAQPLEILAHMKEGNFDPRELMYVEKPLADTPDTNITGSTVSVKDYRDEFIRFETKSSAKNLLFVSEIYYPVNWETTIDGKKVETIKADFAFRGLIVPAGNHTIEMKYRSPGFEKGRTISAATNVVLMLLFAAGVFLEVKRRKKQPVQADGAEGK